MDLILEGPEDDSIGVETCCPKNSNIIIMFVVFDWYSVIYICMYVCMYVCKHAGTVNIKIKKNESGLIKIQFLPHKKHASSPLQRPVT